MKPWGAFDLNFGAKVRWRMRHQRNPLFILLQDKYRVREYASSKGVKTADLLYVTERPEEIPFAELPERYMIKANHGCGWNILCYDSRFYLFGEGRVLANEDGSFTNDHTSAHHEMSQIDVIETCKKWLSSKHRKSEWAYQSIPPKIIIESLLQAEKGQILVEYKVFTFYGLPKAIAVGAPIFRQRGELGFFTPSWEEISLTKYEKARLNPPPQEPACLSQIINVVSKLGKDIDFVRIDLFGTAEGIVLGEITVYPDGGVHHSPTACPIFNKWLGDQWILANTDTRKAMLFNIGFLLSNFARTVKRKRKKLQRIDLTKIKLYSL